MYMSSKSHGQWEIPGRVRWTAGNGGLAQGHRDFECEHGGNLSSRRSGSPAFGKMANRPLLFVSAKSHFVAGESIRGGVPICFPWFGGREGDVAHGFARITEWNLTKTSAAADGTVTLNFRLPPPPDRPMWKPLRAAFIVTISDRTGHGIDRHQRFGGWND